MKIRDLRLFADQNIHPTVSQFLRAQGCDLLTAAGEGLERADDASILSAAVRLDRILLTHDLGFGRMIRLGNYHHAGLLLVRPHRRPQLVIDQLASVLDHDIGEPPLLAVVDGLPPDARVRISGSQG